MYFSEEEKKEIIKYGFERGKNSFIFIFVTIMIGCFFKVFCQSILFILIFCSLRRYAGGYHADSQKRCYVISFIAIVITFGGMRFLTYNREVCFFIQAICLLAILIFSPVENKNHKLEENERIKYGRKTKITAIVLFAFSCFLYKDKNSYIIFPLVSAYLLVTISLLLGFAKNKYENKKSL